MAQLESMDRADSVPLVKRQEPTGLCVWTAVRGRLASVASAAGVMMDGSPLTTSSPAWSVQRQQLALAAHVVKHVDQEPSPIRTGHRAWPAATENIAQMGLTAPHARLASSRTRHTQNAWSVPPGPQVPVALAHSAPLATNRTKNEQPALRVLLELRE